MPNLDKIYNLEQNRNICLQLHPDFAVPDNPAPCFRPFARMDAVTFSESHF